MNLKHSIAVFTLLFAANASATTVGFGCITANDPTGDSCAIAESQLTLTVESFDKGAYYGKRDDYDKHGKRDDHDERGKHGERDDHDKRDKHGKRDDHDERGKHGKRNDPAKPDKRGTHDNHEDSYDGQVLFTFNNAGPVDSFIADLYFMYEDLDFLSFDSILNPDFGVAFSEGARPAHLPVYHGAASFSADADKNGTGKSGTDPGESLGILFDLDDAVFGDVLNAMAGGDLGIGIHVQGLGAGNEFSESLINTSVIPVPGAIWLFGSGLLVLTGLIRRRT